MSVPARPRWPCGALSRFGSFLEAETSVAFSLPTLYPLTAERVLGGDVRWPLLACWRAVAQLLPPERACALPAVWEPCSRAVPTEALRVGAARPRRLCQRGSGCRSPAHLPGLSLQGPTCRLAPHAPGQLRVRCWDTAPDSTAASVRAPRGPPVRLVNPADPGVACPRPPPIKR